MADEARKKLLLDWLREIENRLGKTPSEIARMAQVAPSTITRADKPDWSGNMQPRTIKAIADATGIRPPGSILPEPKPSGFAEPEQELQPLDPKVAGGDIIEKIMEVMRDGNLHASPLVLRTNLLAGEGLRYGDILILRLDLEPQPGDIVCVQFYDWRAGTAETAARLYQPPFVMTHPLGCTPAKPDMVDGEHVVIKGVFRSLFRNLH